ncbi:MAG: hypothetical protein ACN4E2_01940 [Nitrospinota bacterium]
MATITEFTRKKECEVKAIPLAKKREMVANGEAHWFFPHHIGEQAIQCLVVVLILTMLATLVPAHLGPKADPFDTPLNIKPEWYFLAGFYFLKLAEYTDFLGAWAPKLIGVIGQGLPLMILYIVPLIDRGGPSTRGVSQRKLVLFAGFIGMAAYVVMTVLAWIA